MSSKFKNLLIISEHLVRIFGLVIALGVILVVILIVLKIFSIIWAFV